MLPARLHAVGGDRPYRLDQIDLVPSCADDLTRACGGKDRKLQRQRRNRFAIVKLSNERREVGVGQRLVMAARQTSARR